MTFQVRYNGKRHKEAKMWLEENIGRFYGLDRTIDGAKLHGDGWVLYTDSFHPEKDHAVFHYQTDEEKVLLFCLEFS